MSGVKKKSNKRKRDLSSAFNAKSGGAGNNKNGDINNKKRIKNIHSNPFETKGNKRLKHDVLNRKLKGSNRNVALSRSLAHEKRKLTLLKEYKQLGKVNKFADKRFGESNTKLTEEEKVLERFKRLRSKKSLYELGDTDGGSGKNANSKLQFTHLGQTLSTKDDTEEDMREFEHLLKMNGLEDGDDEYYEEPLDAKKLMEEIRQASEKAGQGEDDDDENKRKKSKKEIMEEVIRKAKMFKLERQREKEEDENETERLDDLFKDMMKEGLFYMRPTKKQKQEAEMKKMMEKLEKKKDGEQVEQEEEEEEKEEQDEASKLDDEYEKLVRSMVFEARGAASDRTKTPEEKAKQEREKLEEQQKDLERRMRGIVSDDDLSEDEGKGKRRRRKKKKVDDDEEEEGLDDEEEDGSDFDSEEEEEEEDEDEEEDLSDDGSKKRKRKRGESKQAKLDKQYARRMKIIKQAKGELPFIIDTPETHVEFLQLVHSFPETPLKEIIERIRKSNSVFLKEENRGKIKTFLEILVEHLALIVDINASEPEEEIEDCMKNDNDNQLVKECIEGMYSLVKDIPDLASVVFCNRLARMQTTLGVHLGVAARAGESAGGDYGCEITKVDKTTLFRRKKGGHKGQKGLALVQQEKEEEIEDLENYFGGGITVSDCRCWPSPGDLIIFKAIESIFPATDFEHMVISPSQLLLGKYLAQCPIRGPRDVISCIQTCEIFLDFVKDANRVAPEIAVTLEALLWQALGTTNEKKSVAVKSDRFVCPQLLSSGRNGILASQLDWLRGGKKSSSKKTKKSAPCLLTYSMLSYGKNGLTSKLNESIRTSIVSKLLQLSRAFIDCISTCPSADVYSQSIQNCLAGRKESSFVKEDLDVVCGSIEKVIEDANKKRQPMRLLQEKTRAIQSINPLFNENYKWTKEGHDPDRERAEMKKLKKQLHRERKGVARELRKDAQFIAEQRNEDKQKRLEELRSERQRNFALLTQDAGMMNKAVREYGAIGAGSSGVDMRGRRKK